MPSQISASVGASGQNRRPDVETVQRLLIQCGVNPGPVDGICGPSTVRAILDFQAGFLARPDGRIDLNGTSWQQLNSGSRPGATPSRPASPVTAPPSPPSDSTQNLTMRVPRPARESINSGLVAVSPAFMVQQLGQPRESYSTNCQPMTNAILQRHIVTASVGPFRVTGLAPAVASLRAALAQVQREQPAVYAALGTAGMLCCRYVRGSTTAISNHSWGTAVDFTLNGVLDRRGDNQVQVGLTLIASIMNQHGWYWGVAFRTEDAMHFEASRSLISQWAPQLR
ncbi:MAG: M15 family metallopeptidase [Planctomycetota bacterium]|jgi:peptidoglycan hydrolase-like protein with peptidoglycan-binding domain